MGIPSVQVWLGQEATIDAVPTWVDVTAYVRLDRGLTVTRGSTYGSGAQPGTASLTLDNTDGRFTVGNVSSPLYPYVHLQSLVKMYRDGRPWFIGRIQSMPLSWPTGGESKCLVSVTLADRLARFGRMTLGKFHVEEILATLDGALDPPCMYYQLTEKSGATMAADSSLSHAPSLLPASYGVGDLTFGSADGIAEDGGALFAPVSGNGKGLYAQMPIGSLYGPTSVSVAFLTKTGGLLYRYGSIQIYPVMIDVSVETYQTVPGIMVRAVQGNLGQSWWFFPAAVMDSHSHVLGLVSSTTPTIYVDGVAVASTASSGVELNVAGQEGALLIGAAPASSMWNPTPFAGVIDHFAAWSGILSAGPAAAIYAALVGTTLGAQAAFLKVLGWRSQAAGAAVDAGVTDGISSKEIGGGTLAGTLGAISASEAGTLYIGPSDAVTWKNRRTALSPTVTLTAADIDGGVAYNNDLQALTTLVSVTQGGATTSVRADDITTIGEISGSVTCISTVEGDGADHASWAANTGPRGPYIGSLKVDLATSTATPLAAAITGDILAGVTLTGMPSQTPPNSTKLEITGTSETVSATGWEVTWTTTPAGLGSARDLLILDDATFGVLDSTHRLAY